MIRPNPIAPGRVLLDLVVLILLGATEATPTTYYVSAATGSDSYNGMTPTTAFATVAQVNTLSLQPGDEVRFLCGEVWRADPLVITRSGASGAPIVFSSYPASCADKPLLSGAQPIAGWTPESANVYVADLSAGANAGRFPLGINQLFDDAGRLPMGRWPNLEGHADGGYAEVDSQPAATQIVDAELPAIDWTGAVMHLKGIRWYIVNREVIGSSGTTLTLNADVPCWGGCAGWGYWLNSHRATLDREGEWFYDQASNRVWLYTELGAPADDAIEGSAVLPSDGDSWGGVVLGRNLWEHITYVTLENLRIERWFDAGITTPINLELDENQDLVIRDNEIRDVDGAGLDLATWVWNAAAHGNGPDGWRGGRRHTIENNLIDGANHYGLNFYGVDSTIRGNEIRNIGLIENLGRSGMGCGFTGSGVCTENGAGIRLPHDPYAPDHTARDVAVEGNVVNRVGMNGIDVFGRMMTIAENVITEACYSKGDCGAIRVFGRDSLAATPARDVVIRTNVIRNTLGNTDGCHPDFEPLFGFGIYIDNYAREIEVTGNTVIGSTASGLLYQLSTGQITGNVLYDNAIEGEWRSQLRLVGDITSVTMNGNVLFSLAPTRRTLQLAIRSNLMASDNNDFFNPYDDLTIAAAEAGPVAMTLGEWQSWTGQDGNSAAHWYTLTPADPPVSEILVNATAAAVEVDLGGAAYLDLDQQPVSGSVVLAPYSSRVLVRDAGVLFVDGFESGDTSRWSNAVGS